MFNTPLLQASTVSTVLWHKHEKL